MREPESFSIPEARRWNRRFLRHLIRGRLAKSASGVCTADQASRLFFGPAEELTRDPKLPAKMGAFEQSLRKTIGRGFLGRKLERVVFVANAWQRVGGVISVAQLADDLASMGVEVKIVALNPGGYAPDLVTSTQPLFFATRRDFVERFPAADVVVSTFWATMFHSMHVFLKRPDFVPAYFVQDYEPLFYDPASRLHEAARQTYRMTPFCFAKTDWICERVRGAGGIISKVPPAIDLDRFNPVAEKSLPPVLLAMIRPSTSRRNARGTLDVLSRVSQERPDVSIEVFGCTNEELARLGAAERIKCHGVVRNEELPTLYSRASVYLDCSEYHGFGRTLAEALACGTPCVATRSGGIEEFCRHEFNAVLPDSNAEPAVAAACLRLLSDSGLQRQLAGNARESVMWMDRRASARSTLDLFNRFLTQPGDFLER